MEEQSKEEGVAVASTQGLVEQIGDIIGAPLLVLLLLLLVVLVWLLGDGCY